MKVNTINSTYSPSFGVKISTKELLNFISKAAVTDNKYTSSALTVTKLTNGRIKEVDNSVMNMWNICCNYAQKIRSKYPELKTAADSLDKYSEKLFKKKGISMEEYLSKLNKKITRLEKQLGKAYDITDFE